MLTVPREGLSSEAYFSVSGWPHAELFADTIFVWEALKRLQKYLQGILTGQGALVQKASILTDSVIVGSVFIGEGTVVEPGAYIAGPTYIGNHCEIRHNAYIRGNVLIGDGCVVGNSSELKNAILFDYAAAPHFAYIGDSILGRHVNLGAGTRLSNLPIVSEKNLSNQRPTIRIPHGGGFVDAGLTKLGAILGDGVQTGCNSVLNPGCLVGPGSWIYPNVSLPKGVYAPNVVIKMRQQLEIVPKNQR